MQVEVTTYNPSFLFIFNSPKFLQVVFLYVEFILIVDPDGGNFVRVKKFFLLSVRDDT